ncbi:DUF4254 domain-containing protein [Nocardia cyriacigeorgica]|uniref:DUF4254 domain-containing protein n=1 Tax=Nocardia cyriacigeorgica TaxID=135487 RepID=UPI002457E912|nr:DUF4254 domain-containing protein [Nocardia cyriacigeorgica]
MTPRPGWRGKSRSPLILCPEVGRSTAVGRLPNASELLCALGGRNLHGRLCHLAHDLADLHALTYSRPSTDGSATKRRDELIADINAWAAVHLPLPAVGARAHRETLGDTIDRIAAVAARAFHLLMTDDPAGIRVHTAWTRLAELELAYGDLVRELDDGRRYLPRREPKPRPAPCHLP